MIYLTNNIQFSIHRLYIPVVKPSVKTNFPIFFFQIFHLGKFKFPKLKYILFILYDQAQYDSTHLWAFATMRVVKTNKIKQNLINTTKNT